MMVLKCLFLRSSHCCVAIYDSRLFHLGAKIKFDREDMGEVRTCEIVGTGTQIECAKQLIDEKIDEDKAFRAKKDTQEGSILLH